MNRIFSGIWQRILRATGSVKKNDVFFLMFHEVTDSLAPSYPEVAVTKEEFERAFTYLIEKKYNFCSVDSLNQAGKKIVVTFDDIWESAFQNAFPFLTANKIPFTVFVATELVGTEGYISETHLLELRNNPYCTIGFHTNTHCLMRDLGDEKLHSEMDCRAFETKYGIRCDLFAFPYGSVYACPYRIRKAVTKTSYRYAFGTVSCGTSVSRINKNPYYIPRINICSANVKKIGELLR